MSGSFLADASDVLRAASSLVVFPPMSIVIPLMYPAIYASLSMSACVASLTFSSLTVDASKMSSSVLSDITDNSSKLIPSRLAAAIRLGIGSFSDFLLGV